MKNIRYMWTEIVDAVTSAAHDHHTEGEHLYVPLEFKIAVECYEHIAHTVRAGQ